MAVLLRSLDTSESLDTSDSSSLSFGFLVCNSRSDIAVPKELRGGSRAEKKVKVQFPK